MPIYQVTGPTGKPDYSTKPPPAGTPYLVCTPNRTYGQVCELPGADAARAAEAIRKQRESNDQMNRRDQRALDKATAECDATLGAQNDKLKAAANTRVDAARTRLSAAGQRVSEARKVVGDQLESLDGLRGWHDTFHDVTGLAIDVGAFVARRNPLIFLGSLALGVGNSLIKGEGADAAAGAVADVAEEAGAAANAAAARAAAAAAPGAAAGQLVRGIPVLQGTVFFKDVSDLFNIFSQPDLYSFATPESLDAVKQIRSFFFDGADPRTWVEKGFGPGMDDLKKQFDDLIAAMEEQQAAIKELEEALAEQRKTEAFPGEEGTCINKRQHELIEGR